MSADPNGQYCRSRCECTRPRGSALNRNALSKSALIRVVRAVHLAIVEKFAFGGMVFLFGAYSLLKIKDSAGSRIEDRGSIYAPLYQWYRIW